MQVVEEAVGWSWRAGVRRLIQVVRTRPSQRVLVFSIDMLRRAVAVEVDYTMVTAA